MKLPGRRKLGAVALIIAGLGAFLVPFLMRPGSIQGTSPTTPGGTNPPKTPSSCTTNCSGGGGQTNTSGGCTGDKSKEPSPQDNGNGKHNGNMWGVLKNIRDTSVSVVKAMGEQNPAFHSHHITDTDNDTVHGLVHPSHGLDDHDSSCAAGEESDEDD